MELANIKEIKKNIPSNVVIVAATKYVDSTDMKKLLEAGICNFGENRVDSFLKKEEELEGLPIIWHFIGHLQTNKVKQVINKIDFLHSLDSIKLADMIGKYRTKPLKCFIEVNINREENKTGVEISELNSVVEAALKNPMIELVGLMGMSKKDSSSNDKLKQFKALAYLLNRINQDYHLSLKELSMGMSEDYPEAIAAGATMVRLGRILWMQKK